MNRKYKQARQLKKIKLTDAAEMLDVSQPTLSAWESERKTPSIDSLIKMADLYGVTTDFLLGRDEISPDSHEPVNQDLLPALHGRSVWTEKYGWSLFDWINKVLILLDGTQLPLSDAGKLYVSEPAFSIAGEEKERPLTLSQIKDFDKVWVEVLSMDIDLRNELRGWYHPKDRFVENEFGNRFYYDTYISKWIAFEE